jgi:hypothetical protein
MTPREVKRLREAAIAAGIDWDNIPQQLRASEIVTPAKGSGKPPGKLPISMRTWRNWIRDKIVPPPTRYGDGIETWSKPVIIHIALYGVQRAPGHGRKLAGVGVDTPDVHP